MVIGKIKSYAEGKFQVETNFGGTITVDSTTIQSLSTESDVYVGYESGNTFKGKLSYKNQQYKVKTTNGMVDVSTDVLLALWHEGERNPLLPPPPKEKKWKYELTADVAGKTGNSDKFSTAGSFKGTLASETDRLIMYVRGDRSKENGQISTSELVGGTDYENFIGQRQSWYLRAEAETDEIEDLDFRGSLSVGYGYFFIKEEKHEFRGRVGLQYRHEAFKDPKQLPPPAAPVKGPGREDNVGLELGLYHMHYINRLGKMVTDITYSPSFNDPDSHRAYHESSLEMPLALSDFWKLRIGISNEYNNVVVSGRDRLDTTYFAKLVFTWE